MGILFVPMFVAGLVMLAKNPDLLRKRLNAKEQEAEHKAVVKLSGLLFIIAFVIAGLNWRFGWWVLPDGAVFTNPIVHSDQASACPAHLVMENDYFCRRKEPKQ